MGKSQSFLIWYLNVPIIYQSVSMVIFMQHEINQSVPIVIFISETEREGDRETDREDECASKST